MRVKFVFVTYYMAVSQKELGTTEFTNLIGQNRYQQRCRFSHLQRHFDRLHFALKSYKLEHKNIDYFLLKMLVEVTKSLTRNERTLADLSSVHRRLQANCHLIQTSYIKRINFLLIAKKTI